MAYIWKGMFSLYMKLPYKEINMNSSCSQDIEQEENNNEDYIAYLAWIVHFPRESKIFLKSDHFFII